MIRSPLADLHPGIRPAAEATVQVAELWGAPVTVTSGRRSCAEQRRLYDRWRAGLSRFPAARPGFSAHEVGLAWDSSVPAAWGPFWDDVRRLVGWEVPAGDRVHAQLPGWRRFFPPPNC